jgi:hypothetical protein
LIALLLLVVLTSASAAAQESPGPLDQNDAFFRRALARMNAMPLPPAFTYSAQVRTDGGTVDMRRVGSDTVSAMFFVGGTAGPDGSADAAYTLAFNARARTVYLVGGAAKLGALPGPVFDPTWNSAFRWMQSRRFFDVSAPSSTPNPEPAQRQLKTIAVVSRSPELSYHVVRTARATCANHDPGWELRVMPISDPLDHPLVGVLVDDRTGLLCAMQFEEEMHSEPDGHAQGSVELRFETVGGLYVMTGESLVMHLLLPGNYRDMAADISFSQFAAR